MVRSAGKEETKTACHPLELAKALSGWAGKIPCFKMQVVYLRMNGLMKWKHALARKLNKIKVYILGRKIQLLQRIVFKNLVFKVFECF